MRGWGPVPAIVALATACLVSPAGAGELPLASPESVGMSGPQLDRIGEILAASVDRAEAPGHVTLVAAPSVPTSGWTRTRTSWASS